jgi:hypothetical protein
MTKCELIKSICNIYHEQDYRYASLTHDELMRLSKKDLEQYIIKLKQYGQ